MSNEIKQTAKALKVKRLFESFLIDNQFDIEGIKKELKGEGINEESRHFLLCVLCGITHCVYGEVRKADSRLLDLENLLFLGEEL